MRIQFHTSIVNTIREHSFRVTDDDVRKLVKTKNASQSVDAKLDDDYFRVLLRRSQDVASEALYTKTSVDAFEEAHKHLAGLVSEVVITPAIAANPEDEAETKRNKTKQRQSKTGFARSAGSVLRKYVNRVGHLRDLDPEVHGKAAVEALNKAAETEEADANGENTPEAKVAKRLASLITALNQCENKANLVAHCIDTLNNA